MKISQLVRVMDKNEEIVIKDVNEPLNRNRVYQGPVEGMKRDGPIDRMKVVIIFPGDNELMVLAENPTGDSNCRVDECGRIKE